MAMEEKWCIDKLYGLNWMTWKFQACHFLLTNVLWRVANGLETFPDDSSAQVSAEFKKKEQEAFSNIVLAVSTPQLYLITSCAKPKMHGMLYKIILSERPWQISCILENSTFEVR